MSDNIDSILGSDDFEAVASNLDEDDLNKLMEVASGEDFDDEGFGDDIDFGDLDSADIEFDSDEDDGEEGIEFDGDGMEFDDDGLEFDNNTESDEYEASDEGDEYEADDEGGEYDDYSDEDEQDYGDSDVDEDSYSDYSDGSRMDDNALMFDEQVDTVSGDSEFISDTGDFVVMEGAGTENDFELKYVDITKIAIMNRIRTSTSIADLVQSIQNTGLLEPLVVAPTATPGVYVLLAGYRRIAACAKLGKRMIPCIINNRVSTPEIPILEALYNHSKKYSIKEQIAYIDYLEKQKGIMSPSMIEFLLQMNSGDYSKLKDILEDNDDDIVTKLYDGVYNIETAFKKLEQRRKKESQEEKDIKQTASAYSNEESSQIQDAGESMSDEDEAMSLTPEEVARFTTSADALDDGLEDASLNDMVHEGNQTPGYEAHKQKVGEREFIDPAIKKAVQARDNFTCRCCDVGGQSYISVMDFHHILPVFLDGEDTVENGITLCLTCHHLVHEYATGDLHLPKEKSKEEVDAMTVEAKIEYNNEQMRFKRIVKLGQVIRDGINAKGIKKEQYKKDHPNWKVGRIKPGGSQTIA